MERVILSLESPLTRPEAVKPASVNAEPLYALLLLFAFRVRGTV